MLKTSSKLNVKKLAKWALIALIVLMIAWWIYNKFKPVDQAPEYITTTAYMGDIENNVMASGKVKAINTVDVGAQVSGEVTKLFVDVGDVVKQGDLVAQIDQVTQKNYLSNQQANLEQAYAALQSAKADFVSREANLESAKADLISRQADFKQAIADYNKLKPLVSINAISRQELEHAQTKVETAKASVNNAKAAIKNAQAGLISAQSGIASKQADLKKAQTNLDTANTDLSYTTIRAPIDGTVVSVVTEQGTTVNANQSAPTIITLADLSTVRINAQISEADVINVKAGMPVYFSVIGNPDQKYDGVLTAIEPAPEQISNTSSTNSAIYYVGYIEVPNPQRRFRIDMTAQVFIVIDQAENAVLIPSTALKKGEPNTSIDTATTNSSKNSNHNKLQPDKASKKSSTSSNSTASKHFVRVLLDDGTVENRKVTVGIDNRVNAQILKGLDAGENVIIGEENSENTKKRNGRPPRL